MIRLMRRALPATLFGQMLLILLTGLLVSQLVGGWFYAADRDRAVRAIGGYAATQRIANLARLVDEAPTEWRGRIVAAASDPTLGVSLSSQPPAAPAAPAAPAGPPDDADAVIRSYLAQQLPDSLAAGLRVTTTGAVPPTFADAPRRMQMMGGAPPWMMHHEFGWQSMHVVVALSDGQFLSFIVELPGTAPWISWQFVIAMALMAIIVVLASAWAVRRVTAPLSMLAGAADRLGRDVNAPAIPEAGSREMRQAARSFNGMQGRLQRLLENRTRLLAALSHDLRTPLTLLRLRTENLPEGEDRERMLGSIGDLDAMIGTTLRFARDEAAAEPARRTDIAALLGAIVDDMQDAGLPVTLTPAAAVVVACQPAMLRRAIGNLVDNAIKYGHAARLSMAIAADRIDIMIDDDGPGIPEDELLRVFEPYYRLEQSRNRETGGVGLGLSIVFSVAQAHGGQIRLANRPGGGLRATLSLPI